LNEHWLTHHELSSRAAADGATADRTQSEAMLRVRLTLLEHAATHSLDEVLQKTLDEIGELVQSPIGFFHFVDPDQKSLSLQGWSTRTVKEFCTAQGKGMHYAVDQAGVWADAMRERRPIIHNDYPSLPHRKGLPAGHAAVTRELVVPILQAGRVVAILGVGNKATEYTDTDVEIVSFVAELAWEITGRKRAEEALRRSEQGYRSLFQNMQNGLAHCQMIFDGETPVDFVYLDVNDVFGPLTGLHDVVGKRVSEVIPAIRAEAPELLAAYARVVSTGRPEKLETFLPSLAKWFSISVYSPGHEQFVAVFDNITERRRTDELLRRTNDDLDRQVQARTAELSQTVNTLCREVARRAVAEENLIRRSKQLRALASELTIAEQRERQRLAHVLHDDLQQLLVGAKFRIGALGRVNDPNVRALAQDLLELLSGAIESSRSLTYELSPPILHQGGLQSALEWLARWMREKHGLTVDVHVVGDLATATEDIRILLFQAARELLFNVVKHAVVKAARVELVYGTDTIRLSVADGGAGFSPEQIRTAGGSTGGFGLLNLHERLDMLGGHLEIDSAPGQGSRFTVVAPCPPQAKTELAVLPVSEHVESSEMKSPHVPSSANGHERTRVLLIDDHVVMRQGLAELLRAEPDMEIVGEASDGETGIKLAREVRPSVVLMDVNMAGMGGINATEIIHAELPDIRIIGLSMFDEQEQAAAMRQAGAVAYVAKSAAPSILMAAIRSRAAHGKQRARRARAATRDGARIGRRGR